MSVLFIFVFWVMIVVCISGSMAGARRRSKQHSLGTAARREIWQKTDGGVASRARWQNQAGQIRSGSQLIQAGHGGTGPQMGQTGQRVKGREMNQNEWKNQGSQGQNDPNSQYSQVDRTGYAAQIADYDYGSAADHRLEEVNQAKDRAKIRKEMAEVHKGSETTMEEWAQVQKKKKIGYEGRPESKPRFLGGDVERADRIPNGTIVIHCSYCGAGNLVPAGKGADYHCYFCWERLEK